MAPLLAFLLLVQPAAEAAEAAPAPIVVTAERLKRMRFSGHVDRRGRVTCTIRRSSGNRRFDAAACEAVRDCTARSPRTAAQAEVCMQDRLKARTEALDRPPAD